jgi:hypothetical protein
MFKIFRSVVFIVVVLATGRVFLNATELVFDTSETFLESYSNKGVEISLSIASTKGGSDVGVMDFRQKKPSGFRKFISSALRKIKAGGRVVVSYVWSDLKDFTEVELTPDYRHCTQEALMLARAIYSETKNSTEQFYVGWVIQNRVETNFRGDSYESVVTDWRQFTAFNDQRMVRALMSLGCDTLGEEEGVSKNEAKVWQETLRIAEYIVQHPEENPLPETIRHFISPRSMRCSNGRGFCPERRPYWAQGRESITFPEVNPRRFLFFDEVS